MSFETSFGFDPVGTLSTHEFTSKGNDGNKRLIKESKDLEKNGEGNRIIEDPEIHDSEDSEEIEIQEFVNKAPIGRADREKKRDYIAEVKILRKKFPNEPWEKLSVEEIAKRRQNFFEMNREQRDFFLYGMLSIMETKHLSSYHKVKIGKVRTTQLTFLFNTNVPISRGLFLAIFGISKKYLDSLRKHMKQKGLKPREHGNKRKKH